MMCFVQIADAENEAIPLDCWSGGENEEVGAAAVMPIFN
jgi:hypothetical protein